MGGSRSRVRVNGLCAGKVVSVLLKLEAWFIDGYEERGNILPKILVAFDQKVGKLSHLGPCDVGSAESSHNRFC